MKITVQKIGLILLISASVLLIGGNLYNFIYDSKWGDGRYYINLFPDEPSSKNYRLVGDIDFEEDHREYYLLKATFPNGGYLTFEDEYGVTPMSFNNKTFLKDDDGTYWHVELIKEKVK